jgi:hypothetical protein
MVRLFIVLATIAPIVPLGLDEVVTARVMQLTRNSVWKRVGSVPVSFRTFHPQGMVKIGDAFYVTSVEVHDRAAGKGVGHLYKISNRGALIADVTLGEGAIYHPGGLDFDGASLWVPVAEYRPDSRSVVYRVSPDTMTAVRVFEVADHIGAIVHNTDDRSLHGVSWGSRRLYRWTLNESGRVTNAHAPLDSIRSLNPSHYVDYQDCKYGGQSRMVCTGVTELRVSAGATPFRLGGIEVVDLRGGRPIHQVPVLLWTPEGLDMTHNPSWFEPIPGGLRAYFMPEDDRSSIYVYDVTTP